MFTNQSKIAVIGLGNIGKVVASNLVKGNREVMIASNKLQDAKELAQQLGHLAKPVEVSAAINDADIIIMSVWFSTIQELLKKFATELQGKIIVDPSNPIAPDGNGGFKKIIDANVSAGQVIVSLLPKNAKLVKAFGTLSAASLANTAFKKPGVVSFYATNDTAINPVIEQLLISSGFDPINVGGIDQSIRIEVFGDLHEFGALGKPVTRAELKQLAQPILNLD